MACVLSKDMYNVFQERQKMVQETYGTNVEFLGGNNENRIGASSILVEHHEKGKKPTRIMIDAGSLFAPDWSNYDVAFADMSPYFESPYSKCAYPVDALFITHCHEDHIGALAYLAVAKYKLPKIYASEYTKDFVLDQMKKLNVPEEYIPEFEVIKEGQTVQIADNFEVSPFNVSHPTYEALAFHVHTKTDGKTNAGMLFSGDYNLREVPFGKGFDEETFKKFISTKPVTHVFMDSTSATKGEKESVTFDQAVENTVREIKKHPGKQVFSAVIARSVQNLAIDLKAAYLSGMHVLIASTGLRQTYEILRARLKDNDPKVLKMFGVKDGDEFHIDSFIHVANNSADQQKFVDRYPYGERYIIISGAFVEEKHGHKSCLVLMSEQNKVSRDANGKIKGKGLSGHSVFTADEETVFMLRQPPRGKAVEEKHHIVVQKLKQNGSVVIVPGNSPEEWYQGSGHANKIEAQKFYDLMLQNCANAEEIENGAQKIVFVSVHGDENQLKAQNDIFEQKGAETLLCVNTDVINILGKKTNKLPGMAFENQSWIAIEKHAMSGHGVDDVFIFDECDQNFIKIDNRFTVINISTNANPHAKKENNYHISKALEVALKLEEEGVFMSNIQIRNKVRGDKRGRVVEESSYDELESRRQNELKQGKKFKGRRRGYDGR